MRGLWGIGWSGIEVSRPEHSLVVSEVSSTMLSGRGRSGIEAERFDIEAPGDDVMSARVARINIGEGGAGMSESVSTGALPETLILGAGRDILASELDSSDVL